MSLDLIKKNLKALYPKDAEIASHLVEKRRFYELKDLVDSAIVILDKHLSNAEPPEKALAVNRVDVIKLKEYVDSYLNQIDPCYSTVIEDDLDDENYLDGSYYYD